MTEPGVRLPAVEAGESIDQGRFSPSAGAELPDPIDGASWLLTIFNDH
jgi:hypothetical protein